MLVESDGLSVSSQHVEVEGLDQAVLLASEVGDELV